MNGSSQKLCGSCHESCTRCNGPLGSDCVVCDSDYNQIIIGSNISCRRKSNNTTETLLQSIKRELNGYTTSQIILISALIGFSLLITCTAAYLLCRKYDFDNALILERDKNFSGKYSYGPITHENEEILLSKLANIRNEASDDESEGSEFEIMTQRTN